MTLPSPAALEREKDKLYLTDAELYRRMGVPRQSAQRIILHLEHKANFPPKSKIFPGRRYWPAVKAWLDRHNGLPENGGSNE
jgi:hypothetical protein